ncbi:MAG: hypothetical protein LUC17_02375 [Oscillospiraceae bacterium]|nr:hypothetical protein [Oscillospiraceae bacterium]
MYDLLGKAFAYRKTKIWEKLWDDQIFAVRHSDGSTGYVCIMGRAGLCQALAVYPGTEGLDSMRRVNSCPEDAPEQVEFEAAMTQDCVSCSFVEKNLLRKSELEEIRAYCSEHGINLRGKNAWPQLERKEPYHMPWTIREESDKIHLGEALDACVDLAGKLKGPEADDFSFPEGLGPGTVVPMAVVLPDGSFRWETTALPKSRAVRYRTAVPFDKKLAAEVLDAEESGDTWMCDVVLSPGAVLDEDEDEKALENGTAEPELAPFFPLAQLILRGDGRMSAHLCDQGDRYDEFFLDSALADMIDYGRPAEIVVRNRRTRNMFRKLADDMGIRLTMTEDCPEMDDLVHNFFSEFGAGEVTDDESGASGTDVAALAEMIENTRDFSDFADEEFLTLCLAAAAFHINLSKQQSQKLENELRKRFGETGN